MTRRTTFAERLATRRATETRRYRVRHTHQPRKGE
jgi:hypothetical protein